MTILLILAGCAAPPASQPTSPPPPPPTADAAGLTGIWAIKAIDNQPLEGAPATIAFAGDRVSGTTGCNRFNGSFQLAGDRLTIGALGTTRMACPPPLMQRETVLLARFAAPLAVSGGAAGTLTLTGTGGETVLLERQ
ncbi:hypothetical protein NX02_11015 [Sphingomonas sanxanigenens DSM 19645 = NX02]|uniref:DUF306 domain-containing protein n=1 Tax=Sphingomonas sanxanigenens DSM 19645 = NX02 TaxID=1123269 RepID=W0AE03_9SPHN|nr:hypothetical protein NX02_11015 [Sphingomonas sanxanigenens DSM 19645 = NX02]